MLRKLIVAAIALAFSLGVADLVCWRLLNTARRNQPQRFDYFVFDPSLGVRHVVSRAYSTELRRTDGTAVYQATYSYDEFGRRQTTTVSSTKSRAVLFFGCSFVDGMGVNDADTLPSQVALRAPESQVLNYGIGGAGPQQMLVQLQRRNFSTEGVLHNGALAIYVFLDDHIRRAIGSMQVVTSFGRDFPYFRIDSHRALIHDGTFTTGRPLRSIAYRTANNSHIVRYALGRGWDWPPSVSSSDYDLTASVVAGARAEFLRRFPGGRFVTVIYPGSDRGILDWLRRHDVEVVDFSTLFDPRRPGMRFPGDGHPTAAANQRLSEAMVHRLSLR